MDDRGTAPVPTLANTTNNKLATVDKGRRSSRTTTKTGRTLAPAPMTTTTCSSHNTTTTTLTTTTPITTTDKEDGQGDECGGSSSSSRVGRVGSSKHRRRFQLRGSTLKRFLSCTFKDLSLGYYISIVMVISFKIFIFANTLNTVMGAKTFYMHWNTSNSM